MTITDEELALWSRQANEYMKNRKRFPATKADELRELGTKRCNKCHRVQRLEDFPADRSRRDGFNRRCRTCNNSHNAVHRRDNPEYFAEYREQNRDRINEYKREYGATEHGVGTNALYRGYHRAVAAGSPAERFTYQDLCSYWEQQGINPTRCYYTGVELTPGENHSLDHKTPINRGGSHAMDNIVPCDLTANTRKGNRTAEEFTVELSTV